MAADGPEQASPRLPQMRLGGGFAGLPGARAKIAPTVLCMIPLGSVWA